MKVEMGESLCCSYLRHVKKCWLVQTNWKSSEHWKRDTSYEDIETMFGTMKENFETDGGVFKKTKSVRPFLKQGEVDVVGVDSEGGVHALDVAFHEGGLLYGDGNANRVLKKLLRTYLLLRAYRPPGTQFHIYFVSPRVHPDDQRELTGIFEKLKSQYPEANWCLITNSDFSEKVVRSTLEKTAKVADTAELFARAAKLLDLAEEQREGSYRPSDPGAASGSVGGGRAKEESVTATEKVQRLVRELMTTLLQTYPTLLDDSNRESLEKASYCKEKLGLRISNLALLCRIERGREVNGYVRYWKEPYGEHYVCSEWGKKYHVENARKLAEFVGDLVKKRRGDPGVPALKRHEGSLRDYVRREGRPAAALTRQAHGASSEETD